MTAIDPATTATPSATPATPAGPAPREQSRARYPDETGFVDRDGVRVAYEVYGSGEPDVLLLPTWSIVHSRVWKLQIPDLARRSRVIAFDPRGNGRTDRPTTGAGYDEREFAADALAVLDAVGSRRAVVVALSVGAQRALILASEHPERVSGLVFIGPDVPLGGRVPDRGTVGPFDAVLDHDDGWAKYNAAYWRRDFEGFARFFFEQCLHELHSTKGIEDAVGWALEIGPEPLILTTRSVGVETRDEVLERAAAIDRPTLVIHGDEDRIQPWSDARDLAELLDGRLETIEGGGHLPNVRDPVRVNLLLRDFIADIALREGS